MPLNIDWQQILLHLFNFTVLFAILYFLLYKPVKDFMDKRTEYYTNLENEAKDNLNEAQKVKEEYNNRLAQADIEISDEKKKAYMEIEEVSAMKIKNAEDEADRIIADAHKNIEESRAKMLKEVQSEISDMVTSVAEKLVDQSSTSKAFDEFLDIAKRGEKE